jgi:hypothetical protein
MADMTDEVLHELNTGIKDVAVLRQRSTAFVYAISQHQPRAAAIRAIYQSSISALNDVNRKCHQRSKNLIEDLQKLFEMYRFPEDYFRLGQIAPTHLPELSSVLPRQVQSLRREHGVAMGELSRLKSVMDGEVSDLKKEASDEDKEALTYGMKAAQAEKDAETEDGNADAEGERAEKAKENAEFHEKAASEASRLLEEKGGSVWKVVGGALVLASMPLHGGAGLLVFGSGVAAGALGFGKGSTKSELKSARDSHRTRATDFRREQGEHGQKKLFHIDKAKQYRTQQRNHNEKKSDHERKAAALREIVERVEGYIGSLVEAENILKALELPLNAVNPIERDIFQLTLNPDKLHIHYGLMSRKREEILDSCSAYLTAHVS